jgi:hypothetical protein
VDARHLHVVARGEDRAEAPGRFGLAAEVELHLDEPRDLEDDAADVDGALHSLDEGGHLPQHGEVEGNDPPRLGVLNLDHDVAAVAQAGAVHLRERCRAERLRVDRGEDRVERRAELCFDEWNEGRQRPRRHIVVKAAEVVDERLRQEVGA